METGTHALGHGLTIGLPAEIAHESTARVQSVVPEATLVTAARLREQPALLDSLDVLYTQATDASRIARASRLRWVQTWGAGVEWLLTPEVIARNELIITNARGIHAQPIAEHVFGFILSFIRNLHVARDQQARGAWEGRALGKTVRTLSCLTLGILGLGAIGKRTAEIGAAFGMDVIAWRRRGEHSSVVREVFTGDQLPTLLARSDVVVNTLPHTAETHRLLAGSAFEAMRKQPFFVNIGRGSTVDQDALLQALRSGQISGAGLDVTEPEPLPSEHPLWREPNVIITPHYSGAHPNYADRATSIFVDNLRRFISGQPLLNLVDKQAGY